MPQKSSIPEAKFSGWTDREILGLDQDRLKGMMFPSSVPRRLRDGGGLGWRRF
jgi:hypothetical protein